MQRAVFQENRLIRRVVLVAALSLAVGTGWTQSAVPPAAPGSDPLSRPQPSMTPPTVVHSFGVIDRFLVNPNGNVDGLLLRDQTQVDLPPPMSETVIQMLHPGDRIRVTGYPIGSLSMVHATAIADGSGRAIAQDEPRNVPLVQLPPPPPALQPMQASGRVSHLIYGPRGDVAGVLLDDGTALRLSPPAAHRLGNLLLPGSAVSAHGFGVTTPYGRSIQITAIGRDRASEQPLMPPPQSRGSEPRAAPPGPPSPHH